MTRTGWPASPPLELASATQARMAAGAGPEIVPSGPASTPKEPKTISLRLAGAWGFAPPGAPGVAPAAPPLAGPPAAAGEPALPGWAAPPPRAGRPAVGEAAEALPD